jgi:hypothetical protein
MCLNCDHEDEERDKFPLQTSSKGVLLGETPEDSLVGKVLKYLKTMRILEVPMLRNLLDV